MSTPNQVAADLAALGVAVRGAAHAVVVAHGAMLQAEVKREAAQPRTHIRPHVGEPEGPRLLTGSYNRSITTHTTQDAHESTVTVGTVDPRGPWLELGTTRMQPYPHFSVGLEKVRPRFEAAMAAVPGATARRIR